MRTANPSHRATKKNLAETNLRLASTNVARNAHVGQAPRLSSEAKRAPPRLTTMPGGACPGWYINREPFLDVIRMHRASVNNINKNQRPPSPLRSQQSNAGTKPWPTAKNTATEIPR